MRRLDADSRFASFVYECHCRMSIPITIHETIENKALSCVQPFQLLHSTVCVCPIIFLGFHITLSLRLLLQSFTTLKTTAP